MADNITIKDGGNTNRTVRTTDSGGVHTPHQIIDTLPALPAGTNNIGDVDVLSLPALPAGTNTIGKLAANSGVDIGDVDVTSLPALPAGTNNIGDVDVLTLPSLPAGTNNIGDVDVLTLPSLPAGGNTIGTVNLPSATVTALTPPAAITGFATSTKQDTGNTSLASLDTKTPALGQALAAASVPVILPAATITTLTPPAAITGFSTAGNQTTELARIGDVTETAPASDTASSGLNGRLQRLAQNITSLIGKLPAALGANGGLKVEGVASGTAVPVSGTFWQATQPVSAASLPLPSGAATSANQVVPASASHGELAGSVTAVQMPSVAGTHALLRARWNNTGNVYIGNANTVTRPDGTTDTTTGYELAPGDQKLYALSANLNELYRICDNAGDALTYEVWP